jgi:hypothetical protein
MVRLWFCRPLQAAVVIAIAAIAIAVVWLALLGPMSD